MTRRARFALVPLLALGLAAPASAGGGDNLASALNYADDTRKTDVEFSIDRRRGGTVDNLNQAEAYASCERCSAVAIAFQIVLASGRVDTVTPVNVAAAVNENCTACDAYAGARQFVRVTQDPMELTRRGQRTVDDVEDELKDLARSELTGAELEPLVDAQASRVRDALATQLVPADRNGHEDVERHDDADDDWDQAR